MKHIRLLKKALTVLSLLLCVLACRPAKPETTGRSLTLMVYMCGSNLESGYGAASADIEEMKAAGLRSRDVTVLVMTGGANQWSQGYDAGECLIHELGPRGTRIVWRSEAKNMGDPETLTALLRYGQEAYPADQYALILWNHGGGPAEGVCWDELFSLDQMTLPELIQAIDAAGFPEKLSWIGFDACLMCSLEVASAVAPYAEYMIASQETEPSTGWNYAFFSELPALLNGADAGKSVIDCYFETEYRNQDILTMACIDLAKASQAADSLQDCFASGDVSLKRETFEERAAIRLNTRSFGQGVRDMDENGYDLVDAADLLSQLQQTGPVMGALDGLREAIVYSRANVERANGLTLYHPYTNKTKYLEKWRASYASLGFCPAYTQYITQFSAMLIDPPAADWRGLKTFCMPNEVSGGQRIGLQLTAEQAVQLAQARLMILAAGSDHFGRIDGCVLAYTGPASIEESGLVSADYRGEALYAVDQNQRYYGPISCVLSDDGLSYAVFASYTPKGHAKYDESITVAHFLDIRSEGLDKPIRTTWVYDEESDMYTNRIPLVDQNYGLLTLHYFFRTLPDQDPLPAFTDWPVNTDAFFSYNLDLPQDWHFRMQEDFGTDDQYFAMFQITDLQQNQYCSQPVLIDNPLLSRLSFENGRQASERLTVEIAGYSVQPASGLQLFAEIENLDDRAVRMGITDLMLNGTRSVKTFRTSKPVKSYAKLNERVMVPAETLFGLQRLETVTLTVTIDDTETETYEFALADGGLRLADSAYHPAVLAETEREGVLYQLLGLVPEEDSIRCTLRIVNHSGSMVSIGNDLLLNGLQLETAPGTGVDVPAGTEAVVSLAADNRAVLTNALFSGLVVTGIKDDLQEYVFLDRLAQRKGIGAVSEVQLLPISDTKAMLTLYYDDLPAEAPVVLHPERPVELYRHETAINDAAWRTITEAEAVTVRLGRTLVGENGLGLCLDIDNAGLSPVLVTLSDGEINRLPAENSMFASRFAVAAAAQKYVCTCLTLPEGFESGMTVETCDFTLEINGTGHRIRLIYESPAALGEEWGVMLEADNVTVGFDE